MSLYFSTGTGQPREPALCQLYRHTFIPYSRDVRCASVSVRQLLPSFWPRKQSPAARKSVSVYCTVEQTKMPLSA